MNKSEIAERARKRFEFERYAKTVTWNTYEGDDDPFAFFPESGVYANGDIELAWLGWQWRERAIAESQAPQLVTCGSKLWHDGTTPHKIEKSCIDPVGDGEPSPPPDSKIRQALMTHWLSQIECNHYEKSDSAICACGWKSERGFNVGKAVELWIDHVFLESGAAQEVSPPSPRETDGHPVGWCCKHCYDGGYQAAMRLLAEGDTRELKAALAECLPIIHGAVAHFKYKQANLADAYEVIALKAEKLLG